jgi:hypothetical protein
VAPEELPVVDEARYTEYAFVKGARCGLNQELFVVWGICSVFQIVRVASDRTSGGLEYSPVFQIEAVGPRRFSKCEG